MNDIIENTILNKLKLLRTDWLKQWICFENVNLNIMKMIIYKFHYQVKDTNFKDDKCEKDMMESMFALSCIGVLFEITKSEMPWEEFRERWRRRYFHYAKYHSFDDFFYLFTVA